MQNDDFNQKIALFRYSVIAPLINGTAQTRSNSEFFEKESFVERKFVTGETITVSSTSIERWYYKYMKGGLNGLIPQKRSDLGTARKLNEDTIKYIESLISLYPRLNAKVVYSRLISESYIDANKVSYNTINRVFIKLKSKDVDVKKQMLRYDAKFANDIWCADSTFGLYLYKNNTKTRLVIIAFIDDASRLITSCKIYDSDNIPNLLSCYNDAIAKYGVPKVLNVDNGKNYRSNATSIVNAKLGVSIHYDPIHTPQSKAKAERFFRTLKDHWFASINFRNFHSIEEFQKSLDDYIAKYNNTIHTSLDGLTPMQRYQKDFASINYLTQEKLHDAFLLETTRKATFDSLITLNDVWYQLPPKFSNRKVNILYSVDYKDVYVLDENNHISISILDKVANSITKRQYPLSVED